MFKHLPTKLLDNTCTHQSHKQCFSCHMNASQTNLSAQRGPQSLEELCQILMFVLWQASSLEKIKCGEIRKQVQHFQQPPASPSLIIHKPPPVLQTSCSRECEQTSSRLNVYITNSTHSSMPLARTFKKKTVPHQSLQRVQLGALNVWVQLFDDERQQKLQQNGNSH